MIKHTYRTLVALTIITAIVIATQARALAGNIEIVSDRIELDDAPGMDDGYDDGANGYTDRITDFDPAGGINGPGGSWGPQWTDLVRLQGGTATLEQGNGHGDFLMLATRTVSTEDPYVEANDFVQVQRAINVDLPENTTTHFLVDVCLKDGNPESYDYTVDFKGVDNLSFSLTDEGFGQSIGGTTSLFDEPLDSPNGVFFRVFGKIEFDANGDDTFSLWVFEDDNINPLPEFGDDLGVASNVVTGEIGMSAINRVGITARSFNDNEAVEGAVYRIDVVGEMQSIVPEPSAIALALVALVGLATSRRRRRRNIA
jgi:hypothetical protein